MTTITIHDWHIQTIIGVHPNEKVTPQDLYITVALDVDCHRAMVSDQLADTVDYDALMTHMESVIATRRFELIEALAAACVVALFDFSDTIHRVDITVSKPLAIPRARTTTFRLIQDRSV